MYKYSVFELLIRYKSDFDLKIILVYYRYGVALKTTSNIQIQLFC